MNDQQFFQHEYETTFGRIFRSFSAFVEKMGDCVRWCKDCGRPHWLGCRRRCTCD